jgi:DNA mismatch repair protein MSH6
MFEMSTYNTRKIKDFATALSGFEKVLKAGRAFTDAAGQNRLQSATLLKIAATFPTDKMAELLTFFRSVFDERSASKDGKVVPKPGVDDDYDTAKADIKTEMQGFDGYMKEMMQETGIKSLKYYHANKDRYQIEVPVDMVNRLPGNWTLKSSKKTHRRYWTPTIISALGRLVDAEAREKLANTDTLRKLFERFDGSREVWAQGLACMAQLDALLSLADVSAAPGYTWPDVLNDQQTGGAQVLDIVGGRHPMLEYAMEAKGGEYIPNSLSLGGKVAGDCDPRLLLLSGPNMGGKSTLLRQTCLITILAQLGCAVPAETCTLTPVDRIFTRVGASDRILAGQSTFYVELAETAIILKAATRRSLCILDELGRGTATHDGTAIAHAVVDKLVRETCCRTLFATHYHSLADDWGIDPRVKLGHMDCMVQNDGGSAADEDVTFLYRLADGSSPKSYGVNVAKLAALPSSVVAMAVQRSQEFESRMNAHAGASEGRAYCVEKAYFGRLCSLVSSDMPDTELAHMACVVWTAFKAAEASACT